MHVAYLITVYKNDNYSFFLEAIDSILNQNYDAAKINIYLGIDGPLPENIESYIQMNRSLFKKIHRNEVNQGLAYTLNRLIEILEDEPYVLRMDSDDVCKPERTRLQVDFMEKNKEIGVLGGSIVEVDENRCIMSQRTYPKATAQAKNTIAKKSIFAHPATCFRKEVLAQGFKYNEKYRYSQDLALWFELLSQNIQIGNLDDVILELRVTSNFYKRRSRAKAFGEFQIYWNGIMQLHGPSYRLMYPVARLGTRLLPNRLIKYIYDSKLRNNLN